MTREELTPREALTAALGNWKLHAEKNWTNRVIEAAARKQLALMPEKCGTCDGRGWGEDHVINTQEEYDGIHEHQCRQCPQQTICPTCHGSGKVYPPETVEKIAETIYSGNLPTPTYDKSGRMIPFLTSMTPDTFRGIAVAVLDALGETE